MNYPRLVYKSPGHEGAGAVTYSTQAVANADEFAAALAGGWHASLSDALAPPASAPAPVAAPEPAPADDNAPPSREELEQMASELGIEIDRRWSDKTLSGKIAEALSA